MTVAIVEKAGILASDHEDCVDILVEGIRGGQIIGAPIVDGGEFVRDRVGHIDLQCVGERSVRASKGSHAKRR